MKMLRNWIFYCFAILLFGVLILPASAQDVASPPVIVIPPVTPNAVQVAPESIRVDPAQIQEPITVPEGEPLPSLPPGVPTPIQDPVIQLEEGAADETEADEVGIGLIGSPILNFPAINSGSNPPDTVIDVGLNHIVQMTNGRFPNQADGTFWQVFDKQGNDLSGGVLSFGALWPAGDACFSNLGDPIVVYDHLADRWLLSQFARNAARTQFWMCIAISQTPTPLPANGFFLYTVPVPRFPDYPKFGVWSDGYYMSTYECSIIPPPPNFPCIGAGGNRILGVYAFERANMLTGNAASVVRTTIGALVGPNRNTRILPADLDGQPPPTTPGLFFRSVDDLQDNANPTDASTPPLAPFNTMACNRTGAEASVPPATIRDCIPQPDSDDTIDALSNRPMMQLKFRTMAPNDFRMVVQQTIDVSGSIPNTLPITPLLEVAGIRWYELQKTGANWVIRQQGTYAPQPLAATAETDLLHRWMGSTAIDRFGNIALAYSIVNDANDDFVIPTVPAPAVPEVYPGIRYAGHGFADPLGFIQQAEQVIFNGTQPQSNFTNNNDGIVIAQRWGDYSALTVDPANDCTFWYSTHVSSQEPTSRTLIASFQFDSCTLDVPVITVPGDVFFGDTCVDSTDIAMLNVCNTGMANLEVESITSSDTQFAVTEPSSGFPVVISPDFCFPFQLQFTPTGEGPQSATLTITSNDPENPTVEVEAFGTGTDPNITTSGELDFGELCIGDSVSEILQVCNTGKCDLTVTSADLVGPDCDDLTLVSPTILPLVISPDFCFEFVVKFEPDDDVPPDCSLEIETDDPDNPTITVPITATVGNSDLVLDPADLDGLYAFPATVEDPNGDLGCYSDRMLVARNVGTCPLVINDMSATAPFSVIAPTEFPITLPPGEETLDVTIRLAPTNGGGSVTSPDDVTGTLTVVSNDPGGDETAGLCGEVAAQSGIRILMVDFSDTPINGVDMLTLQSKGIHTPKPIHIRMTDVPVSVDLDVCGNTVRYHMQQEDLPPTHTTGNDPNSSYHVRGKEGNKQAKNDFVLDQCEFKEFILRLR
jgi:hypothetical protein